MSRVNKYCLIPNVKFNKLTVLDREETKKENDKRIYVKCRCDCGNIKLILKTNLFRLETKSCGCLNEKQLLPLILLESFKTKYYSYVVEAKKRNKQFSLSKEEFLKLTQQNCFYCGCKPKNISKSRSKNDDFIYNGVDRVNSNRGYELNNCLPCCSDCNYMKHTKSIPDFLQKCLKIYNFTNNKIVNIERVWEYYERE